MKSDKIANAIAQLMERRSQPKSNQNAEQPEMQPRENKMRNEKSHLAQEDVGNVADQMCPHCGSKLRGYMADKASLPESKL